PRERARVPGVNKLVPAIVRPRLMAHPSCIRLDVWALSARGRSAGFPIVARCLSPLAARVGLDRVALHLTPRFWTRSDGRGAMLRRRSPVRGLTLVVRVLRKRTPAACHQ